MKTITCDYCDTPFTPPTEENEVRCPKCGGYHDLEHVETPEQTEHALSPTTDKTIVEQIPIGPTLESNLGEEMAKVVASSQPKRVDSAATAIVSAIVAPWIEKLAPTLIVTFLFLVWVGYDKLVRTPRFEQALSLAIQAIQVGDVQRAHEEALKALAIRPNSPVAMEIDVLTSR